MSVLADRGRDVVLSQDVQAVSVEDAYWMLVDATVGVYGPDPKVSMPEEFPLVGAHRQTGYFCVREVLSTGMEITEATVIFPRRPGKISEFLSNVRGNRQDVNKQRQASIHIQRSFRRN